jgi:hypothetical protein
MFLLVDSHLLLCFLLHFSFCQVALYIIALFFVDISLTLKNNN